MDEFVPVVEKQVGMWRYMVMNEDREPIDAGFFEDGTQIYTTGE